MEPGGEQYPSSAGELSDGELGDVAGGGPTDIAHWNYCTCGYACLDAAAYSAHKRTCKGVSTE